MFWRVQGPCPGFAGGGGVCGPMASPWATFLAPLPRLGARLWLAAKLGEGGGVRANKRWWEFGGDAKSQAWVRAQLLRGERVSPGKPGAMWGLRWGESYS